MEARDKICPMDLSPFPAQTVAGSFKAVRESWEVGLEREGLFCSHVLRCVFKLDVYDLKQTNPLLEL